VHTFGIGHCASFVDRLYPTQDATLNATFAKELDEICPTNSTVNTTNLDILTPNVFDEKYYVDLQKISTTTTAGNKFLRVLQ